MNVGVAHEDLFQRASVGLEIAISAAKLADANSVSAPRDIGSKEPIKTATELTCEELAERSKAGCLDAFEQLVLRYESRVFNFFRQFTGNHHDAEDLTQETFVKAHRNLHRYNSSFLFSAWLFTIARRTGASHFRSAAHFEELPSNEESVMESPATELELKDEQVSVWKLVRTLKPKHSQVLWLRYAEGFSIAETARIMRTNQIHIKVMLHRARSN